MGDLSELKGIQLNTLCSGFVTFFHWYLCRNRYNVVSSLKMLWKVHTHTKKNNNNHSLDHLLNANLFFDPNKNRKLAIKRLSLHVYAMIFWWKKGLCIGMAILLFQKYFQDWTVYFNRNYFTLIYNGSFLI